MTNPPEAGDLRLLLPFYANGTLDPLRRAELDTALAASPALRAELAAITEVQAQVRKGGAALQAGSGVDEQRLAGLIDRLPDQAMPAAAPPPKTAVSAALAFLTPKRWAPVVAFSLTLVVGGQSLALSHSNARNSQLGAQVAILTEKYQSASGPCEDRAIAGGIALELRDDAGWAEVAALLDAEQLSIVRSGGFGTLTLASKARGAALAAQIARLAKSPLVASAVAAT